MDTQFQAGQTILLERDYDQKVWTIAGNFDSQNPDHYSDARQDRTYHELTQSEADRLNSAVDGDGYIGHVAVILTQKGLRLRLN